MQQELVEPEDLAVALRVEIARTGVKKYLVARQAGVSESQLSGYLTGRKPVTEAIAERIRSAIAELAA